VTELLDVIQVPSGWNLVRFDRLVERSKEDGRPDLPSLSVFLDEGVVPRSSRDDNYNILGADMAKYLVVRPNDIVFNKLRTWQGGLGVSRFEGIVSPAYYVCRPRPDVEPRFLHHLLRSSCYLQELTRISKWMPPTQFDISWDTLRLLPTLLPSPGLQRAIADYLDAETARIDALVAKKRRVISLLDERWRSQLIVALFKSEAHWVPLKSVAGYREGPGILAVHFRDEGTPLLRIGNLVDDTVVLDGCGFVDLADVQLKWSHLTVHAGELLVSASATSGVPVVVPPEADGAVPYTGLIRVWPLTGSLDRDFLRFFLASDHFSDQIDRLKTGIGLQHWGPSHLAQTKIPLPPINAQQTSVESLQASRDGLRKTSRSLESQINLLVERRQALITAAVTGELEIPGAAA